MSKTVHEVKTMVADVTEAMVVAGMKAVRDAGLATTDYWADADEFAGECAERGRPLVMDSIADDKEGFDRLSAMTEDLVNAAEFTVMVFKLAAERAVPIVLKLLGA